MHVAGVDGCRGGWLCLEQAGNIVRAFVRGSFSQLLECLGNATIIAIDIPIGLPEAGKRSCDQLARKLLGPPRASSVFPVPIRSVLKEHDYKKASDKHRLIDGRGLSKQAFAILPKIDEVDSMLTSQPALQQRVREVHPEVCFATWNSGAPMKSRKSLSAGRFERERLIESVWPEQRPGLVGQLRGAAYQADDLNDAFAALWTARRIASGFAAVLPATSTTDRHGLRMEMWA